MSANDLSIGTKRVTLGGGSGASQCCALLQEEKHPNFPLRPPPQKGHSWPGPLCERRGAVWGRMFRKILIANRGEIACRIMRTASRMGIKTVAVYSDADANALHVEMADEAIRIGPAPVSDSYLRIDAILDACRRTGAEAVHPGYGFLSENPKFAKALKDAGIAFIGPSESAILAMGHKDAAKRLMEEAGVPVVPGYHGEDQDDDLLAREADKIGYPVLIKARAGGGGKGMRRVDLREEFAEALQSARAESKASFDDDNVLIEKFVASPRHIEVQVMADRHDCTVYLFERDCSLQRRHQKVIEEAPAPGMTAGMRAAMGEAAVRAAQAIDYEGAGTVEFLVDASGGLRVDRFYFMEMNTRLQVEHPVTEAITGLDLVELQIRAAAGEALGLQQESLEFFGHAFEARVYAEDPAKGFLPATGRIERLHMPDTIARIDTGVREGDTITAFYDPMIAKVIVHDRTREAALAKMRAALEGARIAGTNTNLGFLRLLTARPDFAAGRVDTALIDRHLVALTPTEDAPRDAVSLAALTALDLPSRSEGEGSSPWSTLAGWRAWGVAQHSVTVLRDGNPIEASVRVLGSHRFDVRIDGVVQRVDWPDNTKSGQVEIDGRRVAAEMLHRDGGIVVILGASAFRFAMHDPLDVDRAAGATGDSILAPMPGLVRRVSAAVGDAVKAGQTLIVLEAMKMEQSLKAPRDGVVAALLVGEGDQVEDGSSLLTLEPLAEAE